MNSANEGSDFKTDLESKKVWVNKYILSKIQNSESIWPKKWGQKAWSLKAKVWRVRK